MEYKLPGKDVFKDKIPSKTSPSVSHRRQPAVQVVLPSSISLEFVRVPAIQKKPTAGSWLNTSCWGAQAPWISVKKTLGKKLPNKKMTGADEDCNMQNAA